MCVDFTDLNKAYPKDSYPLPSIDALVDSAAGCKLLSFLDAFSGYNQIKMHPMDEEKTSFMTEKSCYCYKVMPFGLKNAGAMYQRLMDKVLAPMLGRNVQAYVDDMVVTSLEKNQHIANLEELFVTIAKYKLKLNPEKCIFGMEAGKFLGFLLTERGIEANPDKCAAILAMRSPATVKEVQQLTVQSAGDGFRWVLSVDGSSNQLGSGVGIILEGPNDMLIEQSLKFAFKASNNQAEYEGLIAGVLLAKEMGARVLLAKSDSLLITGQVTGEFQAKDLQMAAYLEYVQELRKSFVSFKVVHVPREQNARADLLAKLASSGKGGKQRTVIQETLKIPRAFVADHQVLQICKSKKGMSRGHKSLSQETLRTPRIRAFPVGEIKMTQVCIVHEPDTWITPYQRYMADGVLPMDPTEAWKVKKNSSKFTLINGELYRFGFTHPLLVCVHGERCTRIMAELHEGICGSHIGGRALATRTIRAGYYWPTMREDCKRYAQRCKQCQEHAD
ncbi:uncharacterized protein [Phaseolus vulgaris]|uniref:uncharacterized protein n=1 Tax=Phaseolus vulgaris TaxID=3885 RepID=UPI0035CA3B1D